MCRAPNSPNFGGAENISHNVKLPCQVFIFAALITVGTAIIMNLLISAIVLRLEEATDRVSVRVYARAFVLIVLVVTLDGWNGQVCVAGLRFTNFPIQDWEGCEFELSYMCEPSRTKSSQGRNGTGQ